jgi:hypothetical protein
MSLSAWAVEEGDEPDPPPQAAKLATISREVIPQKTMHISFLSTKKLPKLYQPTADPWRNESNLGVS